MYCRQWSRSAGLCSGPVLLMIRRAGSWVVRVISRTSSSRFPHQRMQLKGRFHGGLGMELGRKGNLEKDVLHHVGAVGALEAEFPAAEKNVVEAPGSGGQRPGIAHLPLHREQGEMDPPGGRIPRRPGLARSGVGRVPVDPQALAIDPGLGEGVDDFSPPPAEQVRGHRGRGHLYQHHMVQPHTVEGILQSQPPLDFVGLDHGLQDLPHHRRPLPLARPFPRDMVGHGQDGPEVVRGVPPFGGQPGIVKIEPADHGPDVEGPLHRIEDELGPRNPHPVRHHRPRDHRPEELAALGMPQSQHSATQGVHQSVLGGLQGFFARDLVAGDVIGDICELPVGLGADVFLGCRFGHGLLPVKCLALFTPHRDETDPTTALANGAVFRECLRAFPPHPLFHTHTSHPRSSIGT